MVRAMAIMGSVDRRGRVWANERREKAGRGRGRSRAVQGGPGCWQAGPSRSEDKTASHFWGAQGHKYLWSGFGFPFFLMLFAVVSLKCNRPSVTLVTWSARRSILKQPAEIPRGGKRTWNLGHIRSVLGLLF